MPADEYIKRRKFQLFNEGYQGPTDYTGPAIGDLDRINLDTPEIDPVQSYVERQKPAYQPLTNNLKAIAPIAGPWLYFQTKEDNNGR